MRSVRILYPRAERLTNTERRILHKIEWKERTGIDVSISQLATADRLTKRGLIKPFDPTYRRLGWGLTVRGRDVLARERQP